MKEQQKKGWNESQDVTRLKDIGVTKNESSRLQKIADIPDKCDKLSNLQDAYKQIETIEAQA